VSSHGRRSLCGFIRGHCRHAAPFHSHWKYNHAGLSPRVGNLFRYSFQFRFKFLSLKYATTFASSTVGSEKLYITSLHNKTNHHQFNTHECSMNNKIHDNKIHLLLLIVTWFLSIFTGHSSLKRWVLISHFILFYRNSDSHVALRSTGNIQQA